jgi:hypothetical protein
MERLPLRGACLKSQAKWILTGLVLIRLTLSLHLLTLPQATWDSFIEGASLEDAYQGLQFAETHFE